MFSPFFKRLISLPLHWIIIFAVIIRFCTCWAYLLSEHQEICSLSGNYQQAGTDGHLQIARTLFLTGEYAYEEHGHLVHNRPPLHPFFMLVFGAWSEHYWFLFWFACTISLVIPGILLVDRTLQNFHIELNIRRLACYTYAFHPWLILSCRTTTFVPETIILLQLLAYFYFHPQSKIYQTQCISACLVLTHGSFLFVPFLIQVGYWTRKIPAFKALILSLIIISFWTCRNYIAFNQFIPVVSGGGIQYWKGEESVFTEKRDIYVEVFEKETGRKPDVKFFGTVKPEDDKIYAALALKHLLENPVHFLYRTFHGYWYFWAPHENFYLKAWLSGIPNLILFLLFFYFGYKNGFKWQSFHFMLFIFCINTIFALLVPHASYFPMLLGISITFLFIQVQKKYIVNR